MHYKHSNIFSTKCFWGKSIFNSQKHIIIKIYMYIILLYDQKIQSSLRMLVSAILGFYDEQNVQTYP
jgi:hypothetical protein